MNRFPRSARLLTPASFKSVFADGRRFSFPGVTAVVRNNAETHPRLGLAIAKKSLKRAVDRNQVKRWARDSFRLHASGLTAVDVVVLARADVGKLPPERIRESFEQLWSRLKA
ncbi:ribonuclease P protein component [Polycyclovorans algicola]|uniref:ribonuclease P protein component n=1 Tax=Polycyclovorans algicola TaxID=616992 RepID=UPI0004A6DC5F|nr:ribonuclease P protein component [Polycyclovorans algicola]